MKHYIFLLVIILAVSTTSCVKDYFDTDKLSTNVDWDPNMAVPIAKGKLKVRDIIRDYDYNKLVEEDNTGFLTLVYRRRVFSAKAEDFLVFPDQTFLQSYVKDDIDHTGAPPIEKNDVSYPFDVSGNQFLDSMYMKTLTMTIHVESSFKHTGTLDITFPGLTLNGTPFKTTFTIDDSTGNYSSTVLFNNFANYKLDLSGLGTDSNKIFINYALIVDDGSQPINDDESCDITINFKNITYNIVYGDLGNDTITINPDTLHVDVFDHAFSGAVYFKNPYVEIAIDNSYGLPIDMDFDTLSIYSVIDDNNVYLYPGVIRIKAPSLSEIGQTKRTTYRVDTTNYPSIREMVHHAPKYIFFGVKGYTNPDGHTKANFALDTSKFEVSVNLNLPLWGYASYFTLQDTMEADFSDANDIINSTDWVKMRLIIDNGMPTDIFAQVFFDDSNHVCIDSLYHDNAYGQLVKTAVVDANYKVSAPTHKVNDIRMAQARMKKLESTKYVRFRAFARTTDFEHSQLVKFYSFYTIDFKLGIQVQGKNINEQL
jgi:hypothetical protein